MAPHTGTLWQYLGSFILYTLFAIGLIYGAYWYLRKHSGGLLLTNRKSNAPAAKLEVESVLTLEARKNIYVVKAGQERFLIATSMDGTQFLSKLEPAAVASPAEIETAADNSPVSDASITQPPWYTRKAEAEPIRPVSKPGFGPRLVQSLRWIIASRFKLT